MSFQQSKERTRGNPIVLGFLPRTPVGMIDLLLDCNYLKNRF
jgi:hypothetical protein